MFLRMCYNRTRKKKYIRTYFPHLYQNVQLYLSFLKIADYSIWPRESAVPTYRLGSTTTFCPTLKMDAFPAWCTTPLNSCPRGKGLSLDAGNSPCNNCSLFKNNLLRNLYRLRRLTVGCLWNSWTVIGLVRTLVGISVWLDTEVT